MFSDIATELAEQAEVMRTQDKERYNFISNYSNRIVKLNDSYRNVCHDANRERLERQKLKSRVEDLENEFRALQRSVTDTSFILVLIDADGYMFQDKYYSETGGGAKAALDLRETVQLYLRRKSPALADFPIVIKAFANAEGLSRFLLRINRVQSSDALAKFAREFSQASVTSDFVFVGQGKDRVDKKIEGIFKHFIKNPTCRHVLFGACHDNGYVRMLEDFSSDSTVARKVTLLYSSSIGKEYRNLTFQSTNMDKIFSTASQKVTPEAVSNKRARIDNMGFCTSLKRTHPSRDSSPTLGHSISGEGRQNKHDPTIWVNSNRQRVDSVLPKLPQTGCWSRVRRLKYCHAYQINGNCPGGCGYSHSLLQVEDRLALRKSLRDQPCHEGLSCRKVDCFYGHNCACNMVKCDFPREMHGIDQTTAQVWDFCSV